MAKEVVSKEVLLDGAQMGILMLLAGTIGFLKKQRIPVKNWTRYIGESFEGAMGDLGGEPLSRVMEHLLTLEVLPMGVEVISSKSTSQKAEVTLTPLPDRALLKKFGTTPSEFLSGLGVTKQDMASVYAMYEPAAKAIGLQLSHELTDSHQVLSLKRASKSMSGVRR